MMPELDSQSGFLDETQFPQLMPLVENWQVIRDEMKASLEQGFILADPQVHLHADGCEWNKYALYAFGIHIEKNLALCPKTAAILESIPEVMQSAFYILGPNSHIKPHVGATDLVLRCHLGLVCPEGCSLRVGSETRHYREGGLMVFDDMIMHEAWNRHETESRYVLHLDFFRPEVSHDVAEETMKLIRVRMVTQNYPQLLPRILASGVEADPEVWDYFVKHKVSLREEDYSPEEWQVYQRWYQDGEA